MQEKNSDKKSFLDLFKGKKRFDILIIAGILGLMGIIYFSKPQSNSGLLGTSNEAVQTEDEASVSTVADEELRLKQVLSCIQGAGQVEVMITYESTPEKVPAVNKDTQASTTNDDTGTGSRTQTSERATDSSVTTQSGGSTQPLIVTQKRPNVIGVIVVAEGAYDFKVRMNLLNAVHTALNVPVNIIDVFTMEQATNNELKE